MKRNDRDSNPGGCYPNTISNRAPSASRPPFQSSQTVCQDLNLVLRNTNVFALRCSDRVNYRQLVTFKREEFRFSFELEVRDSNPRRPEPTDLQSAPFNHSGNLQNSRKSLVKDRNSSDRARTCDPTVNSRLLYQLSYARSSNKR